MTPIKNLSLLALLIFTSLISSIQAAEPVGIVKLRAQAASLQEQGNFKDALARYKKLLIETDSSRSGLDLENAVKCLKKLELNQQYDPLIRSVLKHHSNNWRVIATLAETYRYLPNSETSSGLLPFSDHEEIPPRKADPEADHHRALQLFEKAMQLSQAAKAPAASQADILLHFSDCFAEIPYYHLTLLTPLHSAWKPLSKKRIKQLNELPLTLKKPLFYKLPASWKKSSDDGERLRWLLAQAAQIDPTRTPRYQQRLAQFLHPVYGTAIPYTLNKKEIKALQLKLRALKSNQTMLYLPAVSKLPVVITMPQDQNFLTLLHAAASRGNQSIANTANNTLSQEYLTRQQRPLAAKLWQDAIKQHGKGKQSWRAEKLDDIVGDWGKLRTTNDTNLVNHQPEISLSYRNASSATFKIYQFDDEAAIQAFIKLLRSNPRKIDPDLEDVDEIQDLISTRWGKKFLRPAVASWTVKLQPGSRHDDQSIDLKLPIQKAGWYLLRAEMGKSKRPCLLTIPITDLIIIRRDEPKSWLYTLLDATTGKPIPNAKFTFTSSAIQELDRKNLRGRRQNILTGGFTSSADKRGFLRIPHTQFKPLTEDPDDTSWLTTAHTPDGRISWRNMEDLDSYKSNLQNQDPQQIISAIALTDRPIYRPGQEIQFKFWVGKRQKNKPPHLLVNQKFRLEIVLGPDQQIVKEFHNLTTDAWGSIEQQWQLPDDAKLGNARVILYHEKTEKDPMAKSIGSADFDVEAYRKPTFEIHIDTPENGIIAGKKFTTTIRANYLHGAPVQGAKVSLKIVNSPFFTRNPHTLHEAEHTLNENGEFSLTLVADSDKKFKSSSYEITATVTDSSHRVEETSEYISTNQKSFRTEMKSDKKAYSPGDTATLSLNSFNNNIDPINSHGTLKFFRLNYSKSGKDKSTLIHQEKVTINQTTKIKFKFPTGGTYSAELTATNAEGENSKPTEIEIIVSGGGPDSYAFSSLRAIVQKHQYQLKQTAKIYLCAPAAGGTAVVFIRSARPGKERLKIVPMPSKVSTISIPLQPHDSPNLAISVWWVGQGQYHEDTEIIKIETKETPWKLTLIPEPKTLKPHTKGRVKIKLTDDLGKPVQGAVTLVVYDKAIDILAGYAGEDRIYRYFSGFPSRYAREDIEANLDWQLYGFTPPGIRSMPVLNESRISSANLAGIIWAPGGTSGDDGGIFPVTPATPITTAGNRSGDFAITRDRSDAFLNNPNYAANKVSEKLPKEKIRSLFTDLVKWQGSIVTDANGEASIEIDYPDNLTTWIIRAWAVGKDLHFTETATEVITSKDLIVQLQTPRYFTETDEISITARILNNTEKAIEIDAVLESQSNHLIITSAALQPKLSIPAKGLITLKWMTKAAKEGTAQLLVKVASDTLSDAAKLSIPVQVHGIERLESWSRVITPAQPIAHIKFTIPAARKPALSQLSISLSPSLAMALADAIPYLAQYPYGCTEQTMNRFVPAVIARHSLTRLGIDLAAVKTRWQAEQAAGNRTPSSDEFLNPIFDTGEIDKMIHAGTNRLWRMQNSDGGWGWFSGAHAQSAAHTTATVLHGLLKAKSAGISLKQDRIDAAIQWLKTHEAKEFAALKLYQTKPKSKSHTKAHPSNIDAFVRCVLGESGDHHNGMTSMLFAHKTKLSTYGKCLLGHELHRRNQKTRLAAVLSNIRQYQRRDPATQELWLQLPNSRYAWSWSDDPIETQAWYLSLLVKTEPRSQTTRELVKHLISSRKFGGRWKSTRATAYCVEAISSYLLQNKPQQDKITAELWLDGKRIKQIQLDPKSAKSLSITIPNKALTTGDHTLEIRSTSKSPLYTTTTLSVFDQQKIIPASSGELSVSRQYYRIETESHEVKSIGKNGTTVSKKASRETRTLLTEKDIIPVGSIIEVVLNIHNKHNAEYLLIEDNKPAGFEPIDKFSGHTYHQNLSAWRELRDAKTAFMIHFLPVGNHSLSYRLRAEMIGNMSALPASFEAMYAPELKANSIESPLRVNGP